MSASTEMVLPDRLSLVPPFPPIATRLLGMLGCESVEIKQLADLISSDPMFTGRILQYANSAEFGLLQPIQNVRQAVMTLGIDRTRRISLAAAAGVYARVALRTAELRRCWQHTMATAALADEIARRCRTYMDSAYAAGIVHDIGRLGLVVAYPAEYEKTMRDAAAHCMDLLDYEREIFGVDHAEAGRLLSLRWHLPEEFRIVTGRHHDACEGSDLSLLRIIHVSCRLADYFGYDVTRPLVVAQYEDIVAELPEPMQARLANAPSQLRAAIRRSLRTFDAKDDTDDAQEVWMKIHEEVADEEVEDEAVDEPSMPEMVIQPPLAGPSLLHRLMAWLAGCMSPRPAR